MSEEIAPEPFIQYNPKVRWVIPERLDQITYIGKDVFAIAHDIYIIFFNYKTNAEHVYVANCPENGDGVDAIAGHRSPMFAFAEKAKHPRIIVAKYPNFIKITELQDDQVTRYKGLCMMECDLIAAFSGFPDYSVTIWSWRTSQRLVAVNTGIVARQQIYMASRTHMLICECHSEGLVVWEVAQCYKKCFLLQRDKKALRSWETNEAKLVGVCWTSEGHLYAIDHKANLYSVVSDGIGMVTTIEWSEELEGVNTPCICAFYNGILIFGPDLCLRVLKKVDKTWKVVSTFIPKDPVERLVSNSTCDMATMWTNSGFVYKITGESEEKIEVNIFTVKQRCITKIQLLAPDYNYFAVMDSNGVIYLHEVATLKLLRMKFIKGKDVSFQTSPVEPLLIIFGEVGDNYGMVLHLFFPHKYTKKVSSICLTHQIVSHVTFSPTGREVVAAAMSAGQIFIFKLSKDHKLTLLRYTSIGRGLADCFLMRVGPTMRCFSLVLVSDKYLIGERIICVNAETGKDNKLAGKMQGPYARLLPASTKDTMVGIPHHSRQFHILKLSGEKGVTITVKMGAIIDSGHEIRHFDGFMNTNAFITYAYDGSVILRHSSAPEEYEFKFTLSHRYEKGIKMAVIDAQNKVVLHLAGNGTVVCTYLNNEPEKELLLEAPPPSKYEQEGNTIRIIDEGAINYHDHQELKRIDQEASDFQQQREEVVKNFKLLQVNLVELLEENIAEPALHQLSLSEFNLHLEAKKERLKQAEWEREEIRLATEARIRAQDKVAAWIKRQCWDTMLAPRVKMFAIFSHYKVENFAVLPSQRDVWPELKQIEALRAIEMEKNYDLFQPWIDYHLDEPDNIASPSVPIDVPISMGSLRTSVRAELSTDRAELSRESVGGAQPYVLSGTMTHHFVDVPQYMIPQTQAFSFLQTHFLEHIVKLNTQKVRMWFNKQFDELVTIKKREVGLVEERNARLRFIIDELNKLSDLRGSFHHLNIAIQTPQWQQEEHVHKLTKVEPEECSIEPYISPSQVVIIPPDPGPKDDFRERALMEMMDGVLEKLWHEEIKKPIPKPQCMLEKEPEHFNEDDLRLVFEYEAKVAARNEERDKYRKMLHAEYGKLAQVLNEGIVKFNAKVKELWLTRLKVDSSNGQEHLNLMRLRRINLDRIENDEKLERMRGDIGRLEKEVEDLSSELHEIQEQSTELQAAYEALTIKDKHMEKTFKNHFADLSPIIVEQCYKFFKKRPKWQQRASMTPAVLLELALGVLAAQRPPLLHPDCFEYYKAMDQLDQITNMPPVMDEGLWVTMCKLRRAKTENEIRMRALTQEIAFVESAHSVWSKAIAARRTQLSLLSNKITEHRAQVEFTARNKTIQLVLPAGQVEIVTTGHMSDFEDATLIPRAYIEDINNVILKVGALKLRMMRKQTEFRKVILAKEWEHAQMKMKLRHMEQELYSYQRLKIPKELQRYLKEKELGYTDEHDYMRLEKEMEASKRAVDKVLTEQIHKVEELELKSSALQAQRNKLEDLITSLTVKVSEKRLREDPLEPIRRRRIFKKRMETLMMRGNLIREVQANHSTIVMLQTELELLRLKTYPTLASFRTY